MSTSPASGSAPLIALLGPQRLQPNLAEVMDRLGVRGKVAAITAGWQERESEDQELRDHISRPLLNLELHRRSEEIFASDPELFAAHRRRQDRLRALLGLYRYRLDFTIQPTRELMQRLRKEGSELLREELTLAIEALRRLDAEYMERVRAENQRFERKHSPGQRPAVARHRREVREHLDEAEVIAVAGGHVAVLLGRMRLLGLGRELAAKPIFAWSAGAMALAERIVLFHDHPPQGAGNAEVLEEGLGLFPGLIPLPHATYRLRLADPARIALFARRFAPATCVPLDAGDGLLWRDEAWHPEPGTRRLDPTGELRPMEAP